MSRRSPSSCLLSRWGRWICTALIRLVRRLTVSSLRRRTSSMARASPAGAAFSRQRAPSRPIHADDVIPLVVVIGLGELRLDCAPAPRRWRRLELHAVALRASPPPSCSSRSVCSPPSSWLSLTAWYIDLLIVAALLAGVAHVPEGQIVVAVQRLDHPGLEVELHAHLAEIVAEQVAQFPAQRRIAPALPVLREQAAGLEHERVVVAVVQVDQRPRKTRHQRHGGECEARQRHVERLPQAPQTRHLAHRQMLHARILDEPDQRHLDRPQLAQGKLVRRVHQVRRGVRGRRRGTVRPDPGRGTPRRPAACGCRRPRWTRACPACPPGPESSAAGPAGAPTAPADRRRAAVRRR